MDTSYNKIFESSISTDKIDFGCDEAYSMQGISISSKLFIDDDYIKNITNSKI